MHDENKYPTLRFLKCKKCGNVFTGSLTGDAECPECLSQDAIYYRPYEETHDESLGESEK